MVSARSSVVFFIWLTLDTLQNPANKSYFAESNLCITRDSSVKVSLGKFTKPRPYSGPLVSQNGPATVGFFITRTRKLLVDPAEGITGITELDDHIE